MNSELIREKISEWLLPLMAERDFFLVDVRFPMGRKIEVYIDTDEGIHIDECAEVSRHLEKHLDGSGLVPENYILEVSSPGMSNPLKVARQYRKRIGRTLDIVKTDGQKIEAELVAADENQITIRELPKTVKKKKTEQTTDALKEWQLPYGEIKKAVVVFNFK